MRCSLVPRRKGLGSGRGFDALFFVLGFRNLAAALPRLRGFSARVESDRRFHLFRTSLSEEDATMTNGSKPKETKETPPKDQGKGQGPKQSAKGTK